MHAAAGWVPAAQSNSTLQHRGDTFFFFFPFSFFFVSLPLYFRFNFSLFVAAPANGDAGGRGEGEDFLSPLRSPASFHLGSVQGENRKFWILEFENNWIRFEQHLFLQFWIFLISSK